MSNLYEYKNEEHLHCTAKFYGRNKQLDDYVKNQNVSLNIGKAFLMKITGFSITQRTICLYLNFLAALECVKVKEFSKLKKNAGNFRQ